LQPFRSAVAFAAAWGRWHSDFVKPTAGQFYFLSSFFTPHKRSTAYPTANFTFFFLTGIVPFPQAGLQRSVSRRPRKLGRVCFPRRGGVGFLFFKVLFLFFRFFSEFSFPVSFLGFRFSGFFFPAPFSVSSRKFFLGFLYRSGRSLSPAQLPNPDPSSAVSLFHPSPLRTHKPKGFSSHRPFSILSFSGLTSPLSSCISWFPFFYPPFVGFMFFLSRLRRSCGGRRLRHLFSTLSGPEAASTHLLLDFRRLPSKLIQNNT